MANSAASLTMSRTSASIFFSSSSLPSLLLQNALAHLLDRIVLVAHLLHFLARAVFRRVRHRVAAIAVGQHLEDVRALAVAAPLRRAFCAGGLHGAHVHAVDLLAGDVEREPALGEVGLSPRSA